MTDDTVAMASSIGLVRAAAPWAVGLAALAGIGATLQWGALGALSVAVGAALAGASIALMASALGTLLSSGASSSSGRAWTLVLFVLRHAGIAAAAWFALGMGLPAAGFLAGVTAWPAALAVAGFRTAGTAVERT